MNINVIIIIVHKIQSCQIKKQIIIDSQIQNNSDSTRMIKDVEKSLKKAIRQLSQKGQVYDPQNKNSWYYPNKYTYPHVHVQNQYLGTDSSPLVQNDKCINQKKFTSLIDAIEPNKEESIDVIRVLIRAYELLFEKLPNCKNLQFYQSLNYPDFKEIQRKKKQIFNTKKAKQIVHAIAQTALERLEKQQFWYAQGALQLMQGPRIKYRGGVFIQFAAKTVASQVKRMGIGQTGIYLNQAFLLARKFIQKDPVRFSKLNEEFVKQE